MTTTRSTSNTTSFAVHYLTASAALLDALANPSQEEFDRAIRAAWHAKDSAYSSLNYRSIEQGVAEELARTIVAAARAHYYRIEEPPTKGTS